MSTPTMSRSAHPVPVDQLVPKARKLAADLAAVPSRNRLMSELRIGRDKARAVLAELTATPAQAPAEPHLHAVPAPETGSDTATSDDDAPVAVSAQDTDAVAPGTEPTAVIDTPKRRRV